MEVEDTFCKNLGRPQIDIIMDWKVILEKHKLHSEVSLFKNPSNIEWQFWPMPVWCKSCWLISLNDSIMHLVANFAFSTQRVSPQANFQLIISSKDCPIVLSEATVNTFPSGLIIFDVWHFVTEFWKSYFMALKLPGEIYWLNNPIQHFPSCGTVPRTRQISAHELLQSGSTVRLKYSPLHGWLGSAECGIIQFILWHQWRDHKSDQNLMNTLE